MPQRWKGPGASSPIRGHTAQRCWGVAATLVAIAAATPALGADTHSDTDAARADPTQIEEMVILGYRERSSATATRTAVPLLETPVSVQIVSEQLIEDQAHTRLRDLYRNVSGVQPAFTGGNVSATEVPIIRGFQDFSIYRNGFRTGQLAPVDLANVARIEVLKGPASVLFGLGEPGGLLNVVTKQPAPERFFTIEQRLGSYDHFRTVVDLNSPLGNSENVLGRLNAAYTTDDTFRDHTGIDRWFIAPSLAWELGERTSLVVEGSYMEEDYPFDHGLAFSAEGEPVADVSTFLGEPSFRSEREETFIGYTLRYAHSERLTLRNYTMFHRNENRLNAFRHFGSTLPDGTVNRTVDRSVPKGGTVSTVADLQYRFETGAVQHALLVGVDLRWDPERYNQQDGPRAPGPFPIDIIEPRHGQVGPVEFTDFSDFDSETKMAGVFIQDQMTLADDRLHVLLGARFDHVDQFVKFVAPAFDFDFEADQTDDAVTIRAAALYELTGWMSPYVSVAESFNPTSPFTTSLDGLDPEEGLMFEAGLKLAFLDERIISTVAVYDITKDNVPISDPRNPGFSINGGELRSRGFEADVTADLAAGVRLIANYAYTDTEVIDSDSLPEGGRFGNVPLHTGNVWLSYDFPAESPLRGLTLGGGAFAASERLGDDAGTFNLDAFVTLDATARYVRPLPGGRSLKLQINVSNLLDEKYYESARGTASVFPGAPRTYTGSIGLDF